jgi:DNA-binding IclR family transcriptional regulator
MAAGTSLIDYRLILLSYRCKVRSMRLAVKENSPLYIAGLAKGLALLSAFCAERPTMTLGELASATGYTRSSVQRLVFTLEALGYLRRGDDPRRYELTPRACEAGFRYLDASRLVAVGIPDLFELNRRCRESVNMSEPDGTDMVFVARFPGHDSVAIHMPVGRRLPMYCTASGRAYLSRLAVADARARLHASDIRAHTQTTVTQLARLEAMLREARSAGYAHANGEYYRGDLNVAAPLVRAGGAVVGAINISVPASRWTLAQAREKLAPLVIETAQAISSKLG